MKERKRINLENTASHVAHTRFFTITMYLYIYKKPLSIGLAPGREHFIVIILLTSRLRSDGITTCFFIVFFLFVFGLVI